MTTQRVTVLGPGRILALVLSVAREHVVASGVALETLSGNFELTEA
jgi:hypothetical protein